MQTIRQTLTAPLFTSWDAQYVHLDVPSELAGQAVNLTMDGVPEPSQALGDNRVICRLSFGAGQSRVLGWTPAQDGKMAAGEITDFAARRLGTPQAGFTLTATGDFSHLGFPVQAKLVGITEQPLVRVTHSATGSVFEEYQVERILPSGRRYLTVLRCYYHEPLVEVEETFNLGAGLYSEILWNPIGCFDTFLSHFGGEFEREGQPRSMPIASDRPDDLLARLQMPVLSEYFIPTNKGWFAFYNSSARAGNMLGVVGLQGANWRRPAENMPKNFAAGGCARWRASLSEGRRHWLVYCGPVQAHHSPTERLVFHRLQAQWNALRLDEHLDLSGAAVWDEHCFAEAGFFEAGYRETAARNVRQLPPLQRFLEHYREGGVKVEPAPPGAGPQAALRCLVEGEEQWQRALKEDLLERCALWVQQFQGYRRGQDDYAKNVIGFSRRLRGLLLHYEMLRKDGAMTQDEIGRTHAYFAFAARRILDEGRWPHSRTDLYPGHPESVRNFYTYPGEHVPDKLHWTNSLPNFQSDPLCALLHLSCIIPEHPDAFRWRRFALDGLERQLEAYCFSNGAWEESINYALYTLSYFVITFRILKRRTGIDLFADERMRKYVGCLVRFFGPFDERFQSYSWPPIGNSRLPQNEAAPLLAYACELAEADALREELIAVYQMCQPTMEPRQYDPLLLAVNTADISNPHKLQPLQSEHMEQLGVSLRHNHLQAGESLLFQKIGLAKDHYEYDETAFHWHAKGKPFACDYGTYTGDAATGAAHNLVEIPDADPLRRGFLAKSIFTPEVDFVRCEVPVVQKLSYGRQRSLEETDSPGTTPPPFFYIGDPNPVGPAIWKTRLLLWVKPDYLVLFDRVQGNVPHRYNLHTVTGPWYHEDSHLVAEGRFGLDALLAVRDLPLMKICIGGLAPGPAVYGEGEANPHRQSFVRLQHGPDAADGETYRTLLFARERGRQVLIEPLGRNGWLVRTAEYTDHVWLSDVWVEETCQGTEFHGRAGWMRTLPSGEKTVRALDADRVR